MKVFILEDSYNRISLFREVLGGHFNFAFVKDNVYDAKVVYETGKPFDLILLDHDLTDDDYRDTGRQENNGTEFARWLANFNPDCPIIIHSYNPEGAQRMALDLTRAGWNVTLQPFGMQLLRQLEVM